MTRVQPRRRLQITQSLQKTAIKPVPDVQEQGTIPQSSRSELLPLSFAQQRLWVLEQIAPGSPAYTIPVAWRLFGPVQVASLERSLAAIVQRHESLRTVFVTQGGEPRQFIHEHLPCSLPLLDLRKADPVAREGEVQRLLLQESQRSFDLEHGPLFHFSLLQVDEAEYILVLSMHHSISDGWSIGVFLRELSILYTADRRAQPALLPELPIQYADFAAWQRKVLQGEQLQQQLLYWKTALQDAPIVDLPTDYPRPAIQTFQGAHMRVVIPAELSTRVKLLSQQNGMTLFMTLLTTFNLLLARYSGQTDISVGTPVTSRTHVELEGLIGFFVNTIVLRTDLSGDISFTEALRRVRNTALEAYAHQETPFEKVVEALHPARDLSRSPLFQVMFALQETPDSPVTMTDIRVEPVYFEVLATKFDLTFTVADTLEGLSCIMEYDTALFERQTIQRMLQHWQHLLGQLVENPQRSLREINLLNADEYHYLVEECNATTQPDQDQRLFLEHFARQVQLRPDAVAVCFKDSALTYAELDGWANRLAHYLQRRGIGPDTLVGLCLPRSLEVLVAILGIFKAGAAYMPLDPSYPQQRLNYMLTDAQVKLVVTQQYLLEALPQSQVEYLCLDQLSRQLASEESTAPRVELLSEHLAYIIYTSGTTGKPKGTMISHGGLINYLSWAASFYDVERGIGSAVHSSLSFDLTVTSLFTPLLVGRRAVMVEEAAGVESLSQVIRDYGHLSLLKLTPAHLPLLDASLGQKDLAGMETTLVIGGEALTRGSLENWMRWAPRSRYINEYGPTETVVGCCIYEIAAQTEQAAQVPIGHPIKNTQLYVLDAGLQPVPIGVIGELYIAGAGVARGYINQPEVTAERFLPDPFCKEAGKRMYRSGDRARYRTDGVLEYLGRVDHQVKVRGFRIELGEIEAALARHPAVQESAVLVREDMPGEKRLVAYLVFRQQASLLSKELRDFLQQTLPDYMVPATFVSLEALPLNSNGKVDRRKLLEFDTPAIEHGSVYVAPRNAVETQLVEIWERILRRAPIGINDNFFELGGDSLLGIRMIALARAAGLQLVSQQLFQHQTIADLATVVDTASPILAEQADVVGKLPLTPLQTWYLAQPWHNPNRWTMASVYEMTQPLEFDLLRQALNHLYKYHDGLRLHFMQEQGEWLAEIAAPGGQIPLDLVDLSSYPEHEQQTIIASQARFFRDRLDLFTGPVFRVVYFDCGPQHLPYLLLVCHHIIFDGYSQMIFLHDFQVIYQQLKQNEPVQLPAKTTSLKQWGERLAQYVASDELRHEFESYWRLLPWERIIPLPVDYPENKQKDTRGAAGYVQAYLTQEETTILLTQIVGVETTILDVLLTALRRAFVPWIGNHPLYLDIVEMGREPLFNEIDLSNTVGQMAIGRWLLLSLDEESSIEEDLHSIKTQMRQAPNRGIGQYLLTFLSKDPQIREVVESIPLPEVLFNYVGQTDTLPAETADSSDALSARPIEMDLGPFWDPRELRDRSLHIALGITNGRFWMSCEYGQEVYQQATMLAFIDLYLDTLRLLLR